MADATLIAHCGGEIVPFSALEALEPPPPTKRHRPIKHTVIPDAVRRALDDRKFDVTREEYALSHEGNRMFGIMTARSGYDGVEMAIGFRDCWDQAFRASGCFGERAFVCDNMAFYSEVMFGRKQTTNILADLDMLVGQAVAQFLETFGEEQRFKNAMKDIHLDEDRVAGLLLQAVERDAMPIQGVMPVRGLFREPPYEEYGRESLFTLYQGYTQWMTRERRPIALGDKEREMVRFHELVRETAGAN